MASSAKRYGARLGGRVAVWTLGATIMLTACSNGSPTRGEGGTVGLVGRDSDDLVADRAGDATWRVETDGCNWLGSGSAFAIDAHHLVTNQHVIANDTSPVVRSRDGRVLNGRVIGASQRPDVAVIEVGDDLGSTIDFAPTMQIGEGEHLVVLGYPAPAEQFTVSTGSVVNFQGPDREAILTDAPIAPGSSGGPALRTDGTVAGVVTQMTLDDPRIHVAIAFTAASIESIIDMALTSPSDVLSTCGLGADYVPPAPPDYQIIPPPPTAASPPIIVGGDASPLPPIASGAPSTTSPGPAPSTVPCPEGQVTAGLDSFEAEPISGEPDWYDVSVRGTVTNSTQAEIYVWYVVAVIAGDPPQEPAGFPDTANELAPDASDTWTVAGPVRTSTTPTTAQIRVVWMYDDPALSHCNSG